MVIGLTVTQVTMITIIETKYKGCIEGAKRDSFFSGITTTGTQISMGPSKNER
jgi:hypothetical protein